MAGPPQRRGQFLAIEASNANTAEAANYAYRAARQRYSACAGSNGDTSNSSSSSEPGRDDPMAGMGEDAHPIHRLPPARYASLRGLFEASNEATTRIASEGLEALRGAGVTIARSHAGAPAAAAEGGEGLPPDLFNYGGWRPTKATARLALPIVLSLVRRIGEAQRTFDDALMSHFRDPSRQHQQGQQGSHREQVGRRLKLFIPLRTAHRKLLQLGPSLSRLSADEENGGVRAYVAIETAEGLGDGMTSPHDPQYNASRPFSTKRARRMAAAMGADLIMGPHGSDLSIMAFGKKTAMTVELAVYLRDVGDTYRRSYFSPFAFSRNTGYLRIAAHTLRVPGDGALGVFGDGVGVLLTLPELRQALSVTTCSWFAMNAVRMGAEARSSSGGASADYSFLVPWWCRGGPTAIVRSLLAALPREQAEGSAGGRLALSFDAVHSPRPSDLELLTAQAAMSPSYYSARSVPSGYGFVVPYCAPLEPSLRWATGGRAGGKGTLLLGISTAISYDQLTLLQSQCARNVTSGGHGEAIADRRIKRGLPWAYRDTSQVSVGELRTAQQRRRVEALQTLLEALLLLPSPIAQRVAIAVVEGVMGFGGADNALVVQCTGTAATPLFVPMQVSKKRRGKKHRMPAVRAPESSNPCPCGVGPLVGNGPGADRSPEAFVQMTRPMVCLLSLLRATTDPSAVCSVPAVVGSSVDGGAHQLFVRRVSELMAPLLCGEGPQTNHALLSLTPNGREAIVGRIAALFLRETALPSWPVVGSAVDTVVFSYDGK